MQGVIEQERPQTESRNYCAYNRTQGSFLSLRISAVDALHQSAHEQLQSLADNSQSGLWISPFARLPEGHSQLVFDLIYLDQDCRVIAVESFPNPSSVPPQEPVASALALPPRTITATLTRPDDELIIWSLTENTPQPQRGLKSSLRGRSRSADDSASRPSAARSAAQSPVAQPEAEYEDEEAAPSFFKRLFTRKSSSKDSDAPISILASYQAPSAPAPQAEISQPAPVVAAPQAVSAPPAAVEAAPAAAPLPAAVEEAPSAIAAEAVSLEIPAEVAYEVAYTEPVVAPTPASPAPAAEVAPEPPPVILEPVIVEPGAPPRIPAAAFRQLQGTEVLRPSASLPAATPAPVAPVAPPPAPVRPAAAVPAPAPAAAKEAPRAAQPIPPRVPVPPAQTPRAATPAPVAPRPAAPARPPAAVAAPKPPALPVAPKPAPPAPVTAKPQPAAPATRVAPAPVRPVETRPAPQMAPAPAASAASVQPAAPAAGAGKRIVAIPGPNGTTYVVQSADEPAPAVVAPAATPAAIPVATPVPQPPAQPPVAPVAVVAPPPVMQPVAQAAPPPTPAPVPPPQPQAQAPAPATAVPAEVPRPAATAAPAPVHDHTAEKAKQWKKARRHAQRKETERREAKRRKFKTESTPSEESAPKQSFSKRFVRWLTAPPTPAKRMRAPEIVAYFWTGGTPQPHRVANISVTGLYLFTKDRWLAGTVIVMNLQWTDSDGTKPGDTIAVLAKVVRSGEDGVGFQFVTSDSIDLLEGQYIPGHGSDRAALDRFLWRRKRMAAKAHA